MEMVRDGWEAQKMENVVLAAKTSSEYDLPAEGCSSVDNEAALWL